MKKLIFAVCIMLLTAVSASAECSVSFVGGKIEISGSIENAAEGENVNAVILNKDYTPADFYAGMDLFDKIHTFWQTQTNSDGSFSMTVPLKPDIEYGTYAVIVDSDKLESAYETEVTAVGMDTIKEVIELVKSGENMNTVLTENAGIIGIDTDEYSKLSDADAGIINNAISRIEFTDDAYSSIIAIRDTFRQYTALVEYNNAASASELMPIIENTVLGLDLYVYDSLDKTAFANTLLGGRYTDLNTLKNDFIEKSITAAFNEPLMTGALKDITEKYAELINIDVSSGSAYSRTNSSLLFKETVKTTGFKNLSAVRSAILNAISKLNSSSSGGSGGSGGGGGGSSDKSTGAKPVTITPPSSADAADNRKPEAEEKPCQFSDIEEHWAKNDIIKMYKKGLISGKSETVFDPESNITRAEFIAIVSRMLNISSDAAGYDDVEDGAWYAAYVGGAQQAGLISSDKNFRPDDFITRQEIFKILVNAYDYSGQTIPEQQAEFADLGEAADWAGEYISKAFSAGIVQGEYADGKLYIRPRENATRAQAAAMIGRMSETVK